MSLEMPLLCCESNIYSIRDDLWLELKYFSADSESHYLHFIQWDTQEVSNEGSHFLLNPTKGSEILRQCFEAQTKHL